MPNLASHATRPRGPAASVAIVSTDWLQSIPLNRPALAQAEVIRQLEALLGSELPPAERLAALEAMRGTVCKLQEDAAKAFAARPLPLAAEEQAAFQSTTRVWERLALAYLCVFGDLGGSRAADATTLRAKVAQRALSAHADWQVELCRGGRLPGPDYWRTVHGLIAAVEAAGLGGHRVSDPVRHGLNATSVLAAYAECNLLCAASLYELPPRELHWTARWARRWAAKLELLDAPPEDIRNRAVPLWADLGSDQPPAYQPRPAAAGRWLETTELRRSIVSRLERLEHGEPPGAMQLGEDVPKPVAGRLLRRVLQRWCQGGFRRAEARRPATGQCAIILGFDMVHREMSGGMNFASLQRDLGTLRREREEFEIFGERRQRPSAPTSANAPTGEAWNVVGEWHMLNESPGGLRLARDAARGGRIGAGVLLAVRPPGSEGFSLAVVRWALHDTPDSIGAGIQVLPGAPAAVAARILDGDGSSSWRPAFSLPAVRALDVPASLVLRPGSFRLDREIELRIGEDVQTCRLTGVIDRGIDFERCVYHKA